MSSSANYFKLGVFVISGVATIIIALLLLGVGHSLREPLLVETYMDQSVQGLEVGSRVKYRGVDFGSVHFIGFTRSRYEVGRPPELQRNYVLIEVAVSEDAYANESREEFLSKLRADVARGLRFRLNAQGITGLSYLELDYVDPGRYPPFPVTWTPEHFYVPSAPGTLTKLLTSVEQVFRKLEEVDIAVVLTNLNQLLTSAEHELRRADLAQVTAQATNLLAELRASNHSLQVLLEDPKLRELPARADAALSELRDKIAEIDLQSVIERLDATLATANAFLAGKEADLSITLNNLRALSENLRAVSELARSHPARLLLGAPPEPVQPRR